MSWAEGQKEQIKAQAEVNENNMEKSFEDNLKNIKSILDDKKDLASEMISPKLDTAFLNQLEKNKDSQKDNISNLYDQTVSLLLNPWNLKNDAFSFNEKDVQALKDLQDFLKPYVYTKIDINLQKKDNWQKEKYNNNPSIETAKTKLESLADIPQDQKLLITSFLNDPSKENIQNLQKFILDQSKGLSWFDRIDFYKKSFDSKFGWTESQIDNEKKADWKFWPGTLEGFNKFMTTYNDYFKDVNDSAIKAKTIATNNDAKNTEAEAVKREEAKRNEEEKTADKIAKTWLDAAWLAGALTTTEVAKLNDKTIKIDWDNVVYRWERIPFEELGIARNKTNVTNVWWSWMANGEGSENSTIENSNALILSYLNWEIPTNSWIIWINNKDSWLIVKALEAKKKEIDVEVDAKLKNSVVYNETTNNYEYKWTVKSRDNIWNGESQISLQDFQNEVDKKLISKNNEERSSTTQVSADQQTARKVIDFVWDNWQKIVIDKQNADWSSTKTVDAQRWEREKVVTTEFDKEWNVVNKTKVKEDGDSFKEKARDKDWVLKDKADKWNEFVSANADDIVSAIKDNTTSRDLSINYDIQRDWDSGVNIDIRKGFDWIVKWDFLKSLEWALKNKWIVNLDMKNYKFKWDKNWDKDIVTKLSFDVWEWTQKEMLNKEFQKMNEIKNEWTWETINSWIQWFEYSKFNWEMFARTQDDNWNYQYQKYNQNTNNRENAIDPYLRAGEMKDKQII